MTLETRNGTAVHPIGIGTWNICSRINDDVSEGSYLAYTDGGSFAAIEAVRGNEQEAVDAICYSIDRGQNHIDCAELYGAFYTDEVVGQALESIQVERESLYIADKLWKQSVVPGAVAPTVEQMLSKLGTDYLDLLYIHAPWSDVDWTAAIPQIDALIDSGVVRHFGVSNFTVEQMQQVQAVASHPIVANQMLYNCILKHEIDDEFRSFCDEHSIAIVAYRPVERGAVLQHPVLNEIAAAHKATPAQVAIAWLLQLGMATIPKATQKTHIDENLEALDVRLTDGELQRISAI